MSDAALRAGYLAFEEYLTREIDSKPGQPWRTAGRKTKENPNGEDLNWWAKAGTEMVKAYHDWRLANPNLTVWETPTGVPAIELKLTVNLGDGTPLVAYIDRVYQDFDSGELLIGDLKTGKTTPAPLQLGVYALMMEKTFGFRPKYGAYWMARNGTFSDVVDLDRFPTPMIDRWLRDIANARRARLFPPHVNQFNCQMCAVRPECYMWTDKPGVITPTFDSDLDNNTTEESE